MTYVVLLAHISICKDLGFVLRRRLHISEGLRNCQVPFLRIRHVTSNAAEIFRLIVTWLSNSYYCNKIKENFIHAASAFFLNQYDNSVPRSELLDLVSTDISVSTSNYPVLASGIISQLIFILN